MLLVAVVGVFADVVVVFVLVEEEWTSTRSSVVVDHHNVLWLLNRSCS
jgi:hypothetical protein